MQKALWKLFLIAGSLALLFNGAELALACPYLVCSNFTSSDKRTDCNYIVSQDLTEIEEQEVLCALWEQNYDFDSYEPQHYPPLEVELYLEPEKIDNSSFILAGKIGIFALINYFIFSLTKSAWLLKWLGAD